MKVNSGRPTVNQVKSAVALLERYERVKYPDVDCLFKKTPSGRRKQRNARFLERTMAPSPKASSPYVRANDLLDKAEEKFSAKKIDQLPAKTRTWFG
jgi:hypothetical protein